MNREGSRHLKNRCRQIRAGHISADLLYSGASTNTRLADAWPAEGPPVLWTCEIGRGYSGLIAVGNRVYTQAQTLTEQEVLALGADTGRTIWEHRYGWPYDPGGMYPGPRSTPTWSDGRVYFAGPDGLVGCLRAADGQQLWTVNINTEFGGRGSDFGYACSPLVEDGKVILPVGGPSAAVVALDADSGRTAWTSGNAPASYCSAMPITYHGTRQVVAFLKNELAGFDLKTGRLLWQKSYSSGYDEHAAFPLYDEPVSEDDAGLPCRLRPLDDRGCPAGKRCSRKAGLRAQVDSPRSTNVQRRRLQRSWSTVTFTVSTSMGLDQPAPALAGHVPLHRLQDGQDRLVKRPPRPGHDCRSGRETPAFQRSRRSALGSGQAARLRRSLLGPRSFEEKCAGRLLA